MADCGSERLVASPMLAEDQLGESLSVGDAPSSPDAVAVARSEQARASRSVEWLVGRAYLSAESISLCLAEPEKSFMKEIKEETPELQAA
jgi:hypothetical protein